MVANKMSAVKLIELESFYDISNRLLIKVILGSERTQEEMEKYLRFKDEHNLT